MSDISTAILHTRSPIDGSIVVEREYASDATLTHNIEKATRAQKHWRNTPLSERIAICRRSLEYFNTHKTAIADEITFQMGRPIAQTPGEISGLCERANHMIAIAETALADQHLPDKDNFRRFIRFDPLGTVLIIAPWNYPYLTATNAIYPALLSGNTVLLKHSVQTPLCAERFIEAFRFAGLPDGVLQYCHLTNNATLQLIGDPAIDFVAFTGSVKAGHNIQRVAAERFIGVGLELGGKDPAYVCEDATLEAAVENLVDGAFFNAGQSCCGVERIYVHQTHYDAFLSRYIALAKAYQLGDPRRSTTTLGPVIQEAAATFINAQIQEAIQQGAECVSTISAEGLPANYLPPYICHRVTHDMRLMQEETFGPAVGIMSVASDEEALALMNDSSYGLTASLWTQDPGRAEALGQQLQTGTVFMNRCDYLDPGLVWTGIKDSGRGYALSALGFQQLTQAKSFHFKLAP